MACKDTDLAIGDLAGGSRVLAPYTAGRLALLEKASLVNKALACVLAGVAAMAIPAREALTTVAGDHALDAGPKGSTRALSGLR